MELLSEVLSWWSSWVEPIDLPFWLVDYLEGLIGFEQHFGMEGGP